MAQFSIFHDIHCILCYDSKQKNGAFDSEGGTFMSPVPDRFPYCGSTDLGLGYPLGAGQPFPNLYTYILITVPDFNGGPKTALRQLVRSNMSESAFAMLVKQLE